MVLLMSFLHNRIMDKKADKESKKKKVILPEIPRTWLIGILLVGLISLRAFGIDTFITAGITAIITWLTAVKFEQARK